MSLSHQATTLSATAPHAPLRTVRGRKRAYNYTEVVQDLADGKNMEQIARKLNSSRRGVEGVIARLRRQYHLKNMAHLVAHFLRNGWID